MRLVYNINDYHNGFQNNQGFLAGVGSVKDPTATFFITAIIGTDVEIKNASGVSLFTVSDFDFSHPLRLEGGFEIAAGTGAFVIYYIMPKGSENT
jgi:hypothetical protein